MPTAEQMREFLQSQGKWDEHFNRPASDYQEALYPDGKYAGPVPDYDRIEQERAQAAKVPLTEAAWKMASGFLDLPDPVTDVAAWQAEFLRRAGAMDFEVAWRDHGRVEIYQRATNELPRLPHMQFLTPMTAGRWLKGEERERAVRMAEARTVANQPPVMTTQAVTFNASEKPVTREEFSELQGQLGIVKAQNAKIIEMLSPGIDLVRPQV